MISEQSPLRIQLEGQLEIVEEALAKWRAAETALGSDNWQTDERWHSLESVADEAVTAVSRKLGGDESSPEGETLRVLRRTKDQVRTKAIARLRTLQIEVTNEQETLALLRLLRNEMPLVRVVWRGVPRRALPIGWPFFVGASAAVIAAPLGFLSGGRTDVSLPHHFELVEMVGPCLGFILFGTIIAFVALGLRVALGRMIESSSKHTDALVISSSSIRLCVGDTKFVFSRSLPISGRLRYRMGRWVVTLNDAVLDFEDEPVELVTALRTHGVKVDDL